MSNIVIEHKGITNVLNSSKIGKSNIFSIIPNEKALQIILRGKGNIYAVVNIMASLLPDTETFFIIKKLTLNGTNIDSEGFVSNTPWKYFVIDVLSITGINANINVLVGV